MAEEKITGQALSEDELEQVAGGTHEQSKYDMEELYSKCGVNFDTYNWDRSVNKLGELYRRSGIKLDAGRSHDNVYRNIYTGEEINHYDALEHLKRCIRDGSVSRHV